MYNCTYLLTPDPEYGFIVRVEEIPGLADDGRTPTEAIENIQESIAMALESSAAVGQPIKGIKKFDPGTTAYSMAVSPVVASA